MSRIKLVNDSKLFIKPLTSIVRRPFAPHLKRFEDKSLKRTLKILGFSLNLTDLIAQVRLAPNSHTSVKAPLNELMKASTACHAKASPT